MPERAQRLREALSYRGRGWSVIALCPHDHKQVSEAHANSCHRRGKTPLWAWKAYQDRLPRETEIRLWWNRNPWSNIGLALGPVSGLLGLDIDNQEGFELLESWAEEVGEELPETVSFSTPSGGERWLFRWPEGAEIPIRSWKGSDGHEALRILSRGSQTVLPPSVSPQGQYCWKEGLTPGDREPTPPPGWLLEKLKAPEGKPGGSVGTSTFPAQVLVDSSEDVQIARAVAYLRQVDPCIEGSGGHNQAYKIACKLVHGFRLSVEKALGVLAEYNSRCEPPWSESEWRHKLNDAQARGWSQDMGDPRPRLPEPRPPCRPEEKMAQHLAGILSARELVGREFPDLQWAVPTLLPMGCTLLAGRPKGGKSWLALNIALAIAQGGVALGRINVQQGDVLYVAMEDGPRRIKGRLEVLLERAGQQAPENLYFVHKWPRMREGCVATLSSWLDQHPHTRLVVFDTLVRIRDHRSSESSLYEADYAAIAPLTDLANEREIAIVVVHHTRKPKGEGDDDAHNMISGTTGLLGAADTVLILQKKPRVSAGTLEITGKDIDEKSLNLNYDGEFGLWQITDDPPPLPTEQQRVIELLTHWPTGASISEAAAGLGKSHGATKKLLQRMARAGLIAGEQGHYRLIGPPPQNHVPVSPFDGSP